jgi:uncharacterized membrane protein
MSARDREAAPMTGWVRAEERDEGWDVSQVAARHSMSRCRQAASAGVMVMVQLGLSFSSCRSR